MPMNCYELMQAGLAKANEPENLAKIHQQLIDREGKDWQAKEQTYLHKLPRGLLPPSACDVLDGKPRTATYYAWLFAGLKIRDIDPR